MYLIVDFFLQRMKYNEVYISDELLSTLDCIADDQPKVPAVNMWNPI